MRLTSSIGMLLLAIYLILIGIMEVFGGLSIPAIVPGVIAIIAGAFLLIGK
jgi:hypothetical protein